MDRRLQHGRHSLRIVAQLLDHGSVPVGVKVHRARGGEADPDAVAAAVMVVGRVQRLVQVADEVQQVQARRPGLPVLFVTGYADAEAIDAAGGGGILREPFVEKELAAKATSGTRLNSRAPSPSPPAIRSCGASGRPPIDLRLRSWCRASRP
jgi:hypothetical protein